MSPMDLVMLLFLISILHFASGHRHLACSSTFLHTETFFSPAFTSEPGYVTDKWYPVPFPHGHVGVKSFSAELVDESGSPVPLSDVYLHHFVFEERYQKEEDSSSYISVHGNEGICPSFQSQFVGRGAEVRRSEFRVPGKYAVNIGDPSRVPQGYNDVWYANIHAIDTRGTVDPLRCAECLCKLYNVTNPFQEGYVGGLFCCLDGFKCALGDGYDPSYMKEKTLRFKYTIEWVDWNDNCFEPVRAYMFDLTGCKVEHDILPCKANEEKDCVSVLKAQYQLPKGGRVLYVSGHQHEAGLGLMMHKEDGTHVCSVMPTYGNGTEAGNEAGFLVGMSACYPSTISLKTNEMLEFRSHYSSLQQHTGVMSFVTILVADEQLEDQQEFLRSEEI